jgi:hypothetical protein
MAKRKKSRSSSLDLSPIHPKLHYVLFLALALILVIAVAYVLQLTAADTRARFACPQYSSDPVKQVEEMSRRCPYGVQYVQDANKCRVWVCRLPGASLKPISSTYPMPSRKPTPSCLPKPACLNSKTPCKIPEPINGWCL